MSYEFQKLLEDVSYMRGKMDATFESIEKSNDRVSKLLEKHEFRIGTVEAEQGKTTVKVGIISAIFAAVGTFLMNLLINK